ncbi:hypothetical protein CPC08DRAFT_100091 [Agrocybe pediades]|nr:hypothetical protein CPC08DRAFT_100091 [Agrocybe pediades]
MPFLPQETLEHIIDYLHDDRRTLLTCSLVASKFLPASRYHLFSEVTLVATRLCGFFELLDPPWSSIPNAVSRIVITGSDSIPRYCQKRLAGRKRSGSRAMLYTPKSFSRLREQLWRVSSIRLVDISMSEKDIPATLRCLLYELKGVKSIRADRVTFDCPREFLEYISSLPVLEELSLSRLTMTAQSIKSDDVASFEPLFEGSASSSEVGKHFQEVGKRHVLRLPQLDVRRPSEVPVLPSGQELGNAPLDASTTAGVILLRWLLGQKNIPSVEALRMNLDCERPMKNLLALFFKHAGTHIKTLSVKLPVVITRTVDMMESLTSLGLGNLSQIQCLHIDGLLMSHSTMAQGLKAIFHALFASLVTNSASIVCGQGIHYPSHRRQPSIKKIIITLTIAAKGTYSFYGIPDYAVLQSFDWCSLPTVIEQVLEPFPESLKGLKILLRVRSTGITGTQMQMVEKSLKKDSVWKRFGSDEGGDRLKVVFLPILERDENEEGA